MWNLGLYVTTLVAVIVTTGVQARRLWRHRAAAAGEQGRAAVAVWLLIISGCLIVANTLTTFHGSGPSLASFHLRAINLVPFRVIGGYLAEAVVGHGPAWRNLVGNLVLFAPLGAALGLHPEISIRRGLAGMVMFATGIEAAQLSLGRSADIDDLLLNVSGGLLATTATVTLLRRASPKPPKTPVGGRRVVDPQEIRVDGPVVRRDGPGPPGAGVTPRPDRR